MHPTAVLRPHHCLPLVPSTLSQILTALRDAFAALKTLVASLTARLDAIKARLNGLVSKLATFEITPNSIVESLVEHNHNPPSREPPPQDVLTIDACTMPAVTTLPLSLLLHQSVTVATRKKFSNQMKLHVISWNACGITNWAKLTSLKGDINSTIQT